MLNIGEALSLGAIMMRTQINVQSKSQSCSPSARTGDSSNAYPVQSSPVQPLLTYTRQVIAFQDEKYQDYHPISELLYLARSVDGIEIRYRRVY